MRIGVVVDLAEVPAGQAADLAGQVEAAALDLVWLRSSPDRPAGALAAAAACGSVAPALHVGAQVHVNGSNPVYLAEERHVVDHLLGGRLVLALEAADREDGRLAEWAEVLLLSAGTAPFAHVGRHHRIPAGLPENSINPEERVVVTPRPFTLDPQLWVGGPGAVDVAVEYGVSALDQPGAPAAWGEVAAALGPRALRLRRPGVRDWDPAAEDATRFAADLARERDAHGLDTVLVDVAAQAGTEAWRAALAELASVVRPRVLMHRLPEGLETFWDQERHMHHRSIERQ